MTPTTCLLLFVFASGWAAAGPVRETPPQSLNRYVGFLNESADEVARRFQLMRTYYAAAYQPKHGHYTRPLRLPSSGPLSDYAYQQTRLSNGLTDAEKQRLTTTTDSLWRCLTLIDQTGKGLETYVRLGDYQRDNLCQSDALLGRMQTLFDQFRQGRDALTTQLRRVYRRYQPLLPTDAYLTTEADMDRVMQQQRQLLDTLTCYLRTDGPSDWPVAVVQQSILADEKWLADFGNRQPGPNYPVSGMVSRFRASLQTLQQVKREAVDGYTFAARQSAAHGNSFYDALLTHYNQDLLAARDGFVNNSIPVRRLLQSPRLTPLFRLAPSTPPASHWEQTPPFQETAPIAFTTKRAAAPAPDAVVQVLTGYVAFINESLRQLHQFQGLLRDYQTAAERYRNPAEAARRAPLTYAPDAVHLPTSAYQLLLSNSRHLPPSYRPSVTGQLTVLFALLTEMDGLSTELIRYTTEKQYLRDQLRRSDAILDRYALLFESFDQRKEWLYKDVRRIYESYPPSQPAGAWYTAGRALLQAINQHRAVYAGVKAYLSTQTDHLPAMDSVVAHARTLMTDEYANLHGLKRYGRSNGLCPYSPYEDLADNSLRFAEVVGAVKPMTAPGAVSAFESVYFFYNNELVYPYNRFSELAPADVLPTINQPNLLLFRRTSRPDLPPPVAQVTEGNSPPAATSSLTGYAPNNLILLLDVSSSMDAPEKLPLLKQSVKSLLTLLRPTDQVSVVVYSGKARVALKPTSGANVEAISQVIEALQSDGDTDGDKGIQLAYKLANKHYIEAGNNRIVLATDGEFDISDDVQASVAENTQRAIFLTVFTFGKSEVNGRNLRKIARAGRGNYIHITPENASRQLILEAQATKALSNQ